MTSCTLCYPINLYLKIKNPSKTDHTYGFILANQRLQSISNNPSKGLEENEKNKYFFFCPDCHAEYKLVSPDLSF